MPEATSTARPPPLVTVLMATYDAETYLAPAVDSILAQTHADFEFLVVDDGSRDATRRMLFSFARKDPRIRLVLRDHRGLVPSLNEGLDRARGRYLLRMDADDVAMPTRLARQVAFLEAHPAYLAIGSVVLLIDPKGRPVKTMPDPLTLTHEEIDRTHLAGRLGAIVHPSVTFRTAALRSIGGYSAQKPHAEDFDLFLRLAECGRIANLPETLLQYRVHENSVGHRHTRQQQRSADAAVREACRRRGLDPPAAPDPADDTQAVEPPLLKWAWWALGARNVATARHLAIACVRRDPFSRRSWKLLACSLRGY